MISVLVLSVGLLGLAALQVTALQNNQSAFMRSQVSAMAYDIADRMRENIAAANGNFYDPAMAALRSNCDTTAGCTPQEMAQNDLAIWNDAISSYLPMGQGFVCLDSTPLDGNDYGNPQCDGTGNQFAIKIWWDDDRDGLINVTPSNAERFVISFKL